MIELGYVQCFCNTSTFNSYAETLDITDLQPLYPFTILTSLHAFNHMRVG